MADQLVQRAFKFALAPTPRIERQFMSHAGGARYAYNWGLAQVAAALDAYRAEKNAGVTKPTTRIPGHFDLCKMWTAYKDTHRDVPDPVTGHTVAWVGQNFVGTYQAALRDADRAWKNFHASRLGSRAGRRMGRPRFKSKHRTPPAFQVHGETLRMVDKSHINLPKIGTVKIPGKLRVGTWTDRNGRIARSLTRALRRPPTRCPTCHGTGQTTKTDPAGAETTITCKTCKGADTIPAARIVRATISRGASGTWWCSITAEVVVTIPDQPTRRQRSNGVVGLDLGTRYLAVDSDGTLYPNPQHLNAALGDLARAQRALARTQKDSRRRDKARRRVGTIHEQVALARKDSADRITTAIARTYAGVAVEGWDVQQVAERGDPTVPSRVRRRRNRALADAAPGIMRWQLEYKTSWQGGVFYRGDRYQETGRTCSVCGVVKTKPVPLTAELFACDACGAKLDRRVNTARVVRGFAGGQGKPGGAPAPPPQPRGGDVRPEAPRRGRRSPVKRAARSRSPDRSQTGTSEPEGSDVPTTR